MANDLIIHVKTVEGLMQAAMSQLEYIKTHNNEQSQCREDAKDALAEFQKIELLALRRVCEVN